MQELDDGLAPQIPVDTAEPHQELLQRIAKSRSFSSAHTLRAFLLYVGEHAIAGRLDALKEQQIGSRVLGRKPDYDPAEDNIVRVRARQLRQRLNAYFAEEGRDEPVVVSIPKGHYIPVFEPRAPLPDQQPARKSRWSFPRYRMGGRVALILAFAAIAIIALIWSKQSARPVSTSPVPSASPALLGYFFPGTGQDVTVVCADAGFALWQDITNRNLNLGDYLGREWYAQNEVQDPKMREIAVRRFTSPADLMLSVRLVEMARSYGDRVRVRYARNIDIQEVRSGNVVLLGSRRSNPWVELFEPRMNFVLEFDPGRGPAFRNRLPKPGEPKLVALDSRLSVQGPETRLIQSYAVAALLPSPTGRGNALIIEGLSMEGTEAAGEFVTNPERFGTLLRRIGKKDNAPMKPFEILLKLTAVAGGYADPEIIAYRYPAE
jgi:hypothetical protein